MSGPAWIVTVAHGNLDLVHQAIESFRAQDMPGGVRVLVVNNESDQDTAGWLNRHARQGLIDVIHHYPQRSVAHAWNSALRHLFLVGAKWSTDRVLVANSDVVLRPDTFRWLDAEQAEFVTAVGNADPACVRSLNETDVAMGAAPKWPVCNVRSKRPHPDFSCFMIRRSCWDRVGPFDENFRTAFCEDLDMHVRMHLAGIHAYAIDLPFWHVGGGSQTIKRAGADEQRRIAEQAARNRAYFAAKHGFEVPTPSNGGREYYAFFATSPPDRG